MKPEYDEKIPMPERPDEIQIIHNATFRFICVPSPSSHFDPHGVKADAGDGWASILPENETWETMDGLRIHVNGRKPLTTRRSLLRSAIAAVAFAAMDTMGLRECRAVELETPPKWRVVFAGGHEPIHCEFPVTIRHKSTGGPA